jgi:TPR repeat protein
MQGGPGLPRDDAAAANWTLKLAERGHASSQYGIGVRYATGWGVPQDYVLAHKWYNLAAAAGDQDAAESRNDLASKMTAAQIAEAQKLAREWKPNKQEH